MAQLLPLSIQTVYADLMDQCFREMFEGEFPPNGTFVKVPIKERIYWYYQAGAVGEGGSQARKYVGPDTAELRKRIEEFHQVKAVYKQQKSLVSTLKRSGLPGPPYEAGEYLAALARGGVFRLRACLVGTVAFQCYSALLRARLPNTAVMTNDVDVAQFSETSIAIAQTDMTALPVLEMLQDVDPSFSALPYAHDARHHTAYINEAQFKVELLVPNRGPDRDTPVALPALQAEGQPLRYLDYLIHDSVPAVVLHGAGVLVNVPQPTRYALHKLIVSQVRHGGSVKIDKDLLQAESLISVLIDRRKRELKEAWDELRDRGPKWRQHAEAGLGGIAPAVRSAFEAAMR